MSDLYTVVVFITLFALIINIMEVISNGLVSQKNKNEIIAVRGNCEAEVDQMVGGSPVMAVYPILVLNGLTFFATHGHLFNQDQMPPLKAGDILVHGHTHLLKAEKVNGHYILNPGSTSIPKGGNPATYAILDEQDFKIFDFDGNVVKEAKLG